MIDAISSVGSHLDVLREALGLFLCHMITFTVSLCSLLECFQLQELKFKIKSQKDIHPIYLTES